MHAGLDRNKSQDDSRASGDTRMPIFNKESEIAEIILESINYDVVNAI